METYFDVIPEDIIKVILLKIDEVTDFVRVGSMFKDVLSKSYFWNMKVRSILHNVNLGCVPSSLLNFNKSYEIILMNYGNLMRSYRLLSSRLLEWQELIDQYNGGSDVRSWTYLYTLHGITDYEVLRPDLLSPDDAGLLIILFSKYSYSSTLQNYIRIDLLENGLSRVEVRSEDGRIRYHMSKIDVTNLLTYLIFNGIPQI